MGSSLGIPQCDVHKILINHRQQIFSNRIEEAVSLKSFHLKIVLNIYLVCPTSSFFTNIVIESSCMCAIRPPCSILRGRDKMLCDRFCACRLLSMKFGVRSLSLCSLLPWILYYTAFSLWNSACSPRTLESMRAWYLATHHGNYTRGVFALVDNNDSIVLMTEPRIPVTLKSALAG